MTAREFFDLVCSLRRLQKAYMRNRSRGTLERAQYVAKLIDAEISRVYKAQGLQEPPTPTQSDLYGQKEDQGF